MSDENTNDDYFFSTQPLRPQTHKIPTGKSHNSMLTTPLNVNISPQTKLPPLYLTPSRYNNSRTPSTSKGHRYMTREDFFPSAPPHRVDSAFERPWTSTAAVNATATRSEFRRPPFTSKLTEIRNTREGKKVETSAVVLVGDSGCGKTSLIMTYLHKRFTLPSKSILFETYDKVISFNNVDTSIKLQIWDFPGDEYFDRFRPLGYANAQGILLCFAIDNADSFNNIKERWIPEINTHCPKVFKIMVGIGFEARHDKTKSTNIPSYDQCYKFAKNHGYKYMESSFVDQRSCALAFEQISLWAIDDLTKNNRASKIPGTSTLGYHIKKTRPNTSYNSNIVCLGPPPKLQELNQQTQQLNSQDEDVINEEDEKELDLDTHEAEKEEEEEEREVTLKRVSSYRRYKGASKCVMV